MSTTIFFIPEPATGRVKPIGTIFANSTDMDITLEFQDGSSLPIASGTRSRKESRAIKAIRMGAAMWHTLVNYTVSPGSMGTITYNPGEHHILMCISSDKKQEQCRS
jgi:hypothetical protein